MPHPDFRQHRQVKELTEALMEQRAAHQAYCDVLEKRIAMLEKENQIQEAQFMGIYALACQDPVLAKEYLAKVREHSEEAADLAERELFEE